MNLRWTIGWMAAVVAAGALRAAMTAGAAERVAAQMIEQEPALQTAFGGHKVAEAEAIGALWVVRLADDAGYLLLSGSEVSPTLEGYGAVPWALPPEGSPARSVLEGLVRHAAGTEAVVPARLKTATRLASTETSTLDPAASAQTLGPFLETTWDQNGPYNRYTPVDKSNDSGATGCVATAAAQMMAYYRWPARVDDVLEQRLSVSFPSALFDSWQARFEHYGRLPWEAMRPDGGTTEREKHAVAQLMILCGMVGEMKYGKNSAGTMSSAADMNLLFCEGRTPWYGYERLVQHNRATDTEAVERLKADVGNALLRGELLGTCIEVSQGAHAIVIDGFDATGSAAMVHTNYGWSGYDNGWVNLASFASSINYYYLGFRPLRQVQTDPAPTVSAALPEITWSFPDFWREAVSGFTVEAFSTRGEEATTWCDDFTRLQDRHPGLDAQNPVDGRAGKVFTLAEEAEGRALKIGAIKDYLPKTYTWPQVVVPSASSRLAFTLRANYTQGMRLDVQIRAGNGPWQTVQEADISPTSAGSAKAYTLSLADFAGMPCRFRLQERHQSAFDNAGGGVFDEGGWVLSQWEASEVRLCATAEGRAELPAEARSYTPEIVSPALGEVYAWRVTPVFTDGGTLEAEAEAVATRLQPGSSEPEFKAVTRASGAELTEDLVLTVPQNGASRLRVELSAGAQVAQVRCSVPNFVAPEEIALERESDGLYTLTLDPGKHLPAGTANLAGTSLVLSLWAKDGNGSAAFREVVVAFAGSGEAGGPISEPILGGDASARRPTEVAQDATHKLLFAPGLTYEAESGTWRGWVDNKQSSEMRADFSWALSAANALTWWIENFRAQGGSVVSTGAEAAYVNLGAQSASGYASAVADALATQWEIGSQGGKDAPTFKWLLDGTYTSLGTDWSAPKADSPLTRGLLRNSVMADVVADLQAYCGETALSYTELGSDAEGVRRSFSKYLLEALAHGPVMASLPGDASLTIWGAACEPVAAGEGTEWQVKTVYVTDPASSSSRLEALALTAVRSPLYGICPVLGGEKLVFRTTPVYAYGHAKGVASAVDPQPRPPTGDSGTFHPEVREALTEAAREAGLTVDFGVRFRRGQGPAEEPSVAEVNSLMRCFRSLSAEADTAAGVMTLDYDFRVSTLAFVTVADEPYVVVGVVVESGGHEAAFGEAAQFALNARGAMNARATTQAGAVEVTDATGQTEGRSAAAGQRYFRLPLAETGSSGFFSVSVFSEEASE
ncbi:MAG: C10 family peptidase [Candidatus Spyradenecus sp.]